MKKIVALAAAVLLLISTLAGCGSGLYYNYDMTEYITVGEYSNEVDRTSDDYKNASNNFYTATFSDDLEYKVEEGAVEDGDVANIDYTGYLDGEAFEGGTASGYDLTIGSGTFIPGFEDGLIGATIGKKISLELTFPESYGNTSLAGQDVVFEVTVNYVTRAGQPTEENVKRYGFSSLAEYEKQADEYAVNVCLFYNIYDATTVNSYPEKESKTLYDDTIAYFESFCSANNITLEEFASANELTLDEFYEYVSEYEVKSTMKVYLVVYYILQTNDASLTKEDVDAKRAELTEENDEKLEDIGYYEINIQQAAAYDKALELLSGKAEVTN